MTSLQIERQALLECGAGKKIDTDRIIRLHGDISWSQEMIADVCKCSTATVRKVWKAAGLKTDRKIRQIGA